LHEVCNHHLILMADFNYPGIDWSLNSTSTFVNSGTADFLQTVDDCFLVQHVLDPTRGDAVLDLIFTKGPDLVSDIKILHPLGNSDHNMLLFTVHLECDITTSKKIRDYKNGDYDKIQSILKDMDWESFMTGTTNESWIRFDC